MESTNYEDAVKYVLENGIQKTDRTGTGTLSCFDVSIRHNMLTGGFPLITTKKVHFKSVVHELLWFLTGSKRTEYLDKNGVTIWDEWRMEHPEHTDYIGEMYGFLWRDWPCRDGSSKDQIQDAIELLKKEPDSRRIVVSAWNPDSLDKQALACCHNFFQFYSREATDKEKMTFGLLNGYTYDRVLSLKYNMRSSDLGLGTPFNLASYGLLLEMVAQVVGMIPLELVQTSTDAHIYLNHVDALKEQVKRPVYDMPILHINPCVVDIDAFVYEDFEVFGYKHGKPIRMEVAV